MRDWTFWEWLAYAGLWIGAIFLAIDSALKHSPNMRLRMPRLLGDPLWPWLPLIFLSVSAVIFLAREIGAIDGRNPARPEKPAVQAATTEQPTVKTERPIVNEQPPVAPAKTASPATERIFVGTTVTPQFLTSQLKTITDLQAPSFVEPYIGKWMRLSGKVSFVGKPRETSIGLAFKDQHDVFMSFEKNWLERLRILRQGDQITVVGRIQDINMSYVTLESCEIEN